MTTEFNKVQIKKQLQDAHREIAKSLGLRSEVYIEQAADLLDQVQAAEARELAVRNLDRSARLLRQIEEVLRRLDTGEYGICADCEEEIAPKRLRAVPWAQLCLKCQEFADQSKFGHGGNDADDLFLNAA